MADQFNLDNIQGDVWPGLPKKVEGFIFFQILEPVKFKTILKVFLSNITTARIACQYKDKIQRRKSAGNTEQRESLPPMSGVNLGFTSIGLAKLGKFVYGLKDARVVKKDRQWSQVFDSKQLKGESFEAGMYDDLTKEGWDDPDEIRPEYKPSRPSGKRPIDGVFIITSGCSENYLKTLDNVERRFEEQGAIRITEKREGKVRPDEHKGKEHFGFLDGISQPIIRDLDQGQPSPNEPRAVEPGLLLCNHSGDVMHQPEWAKDGSFLVIRDLQQLMPEFDEWLRQKAPHLALTKNHQNPPEKLAAYLMGRWKNGAPVDKHPDDDGGVACDTSNDFDFEPRDHHARCPFAAHIRKMRPRADLEHDHAVIMRRGIPYGDEVTNEERSTQKSKHDRGLLFACYQSDIRNGFGLLTNRWASNHHFPTNKHHAVGQDGPGLDAIVGQRLAHHPKASIGLPDQNGVRGSRMDLDRWVIHRGGEYFFVPSIKAMDEYLVREPDYGIPLTATLS